MQLDFPGAGEQGPESESNLASSDHEDAPDEALAKVGHFVAAPAPVAGPPGGRHLLPSPPLGLSRRFAYSRASLAAPMIPQPHRKPYTATKQRERWSEAEHERFVDAVTKFGRDWKSIQGDCLVSPAGRRRSTIRRGHQPADTCPPIASLPRSARAHPHGDPAAQPRPKVLRQAREAAVRRAVR